MSVSVELYESADYSRTDTQVPVAPLLRQVFEPLLGRELSSARFVLKLAPVMEAEPLTGPPTVVNLRGSHGYAQVFIVDGDQVIYQHPHPVSEIIGRPLQRLLREEHPEVEHWGFGLVGPGLEALTLMRPTPRVDGQVTITAGRRRRATTHVAEIPEPDPPVIRFDQLHGLGNEPAAHLTAGEAASRPGDDDGGFSGPLGVFLSACAFDRLQGPGFSAQVEEGGFLIGHRYRDADDLQRNVVHVTDVIPAESTGASLLHFTFTGESFLLLSNLLASRARDERILGWYHTHLFAATDAFGLSTIDLRLHASTFRRPWQLAALVNLGHDQQVLRIYRADAGADAAGGEDEAMGLQPYWVTDR
jgi:proteasome lid subunit RPN8/RPN11